jgi:hypothetical protein
MKELKTLINKAVIAKENVAHTKSVRQYRQYVCMVKAIYSLLAIYGPMELGASYDLLLELKEV